MSYRAFARSLPRGAARCQACSGANNTSSRIPTATMRNVSVRQLATHAAPSTSSAKLSPMATMLGGVALGAGLLLAAPLNRKAIALDSPRGSASDRLKPRAAPAPIRRKEKELQEELKEEAVQEGDAPPSQQSAFDPETNTINWDCPCLGGMADGPCGEQFKEAFSCFVFSDSEVKGIECVDRFKAMQDCFRQYPDVYKDEIEDEERVEAEGSEALEAAVRTEDGNNVA